MTATLDEHTQYLDSGGRPLAGGFVFIGDVGADPVTNPQTVFSDRELTTAASNPQTLDANGRTTNKLYIGEQYSIEVQDLNSVQVYQNLEAGETGGNLVNIGLSSVLGSDTITASGDPAITAYIDKKTYIFTAAQDNTGAVTLNIDGLGATDVIKNEDQSLVDGDIIANQLVEVIYNETNDNFQWTNHNDKVVNFAEGTAVASAASPDIWATDGNSLHLTGSSSVTSFGSAPSIGSIRWITCDAAPLFNHSASLNLPGSANFQAAAGDVLRVYADTLTQHDVLIFPADGEAVVQPTIANEMVQLITTTTGAVATGTTLLPLDDTIPQITEGTEFMTVAITPQDTANILVIEANLLLASSASNNMGMALFQDAVSDALAAVVELLTTAAGPAPVTLYHIMTAGTTSAITFRVRAGGNLSGTTTFNGLSSARRFGGVASSTLVIREYTT